jgi:hypothetical protein
MATKDYFLKGTVSWLRSKPNQWGNYTVNFYPADGTVRSQVRESGIKNKMKEDDSGLHYTFKTGGDKFVVTDEAGNPITAMVGNGSSVVLKLTVETFESAHGPNARSVVDSIVVTNLIVYEPKKDEAGKSELPV